MSTVKLSDVAIESRDSLKEKDKSLPVVGLEHLIPEQINLTDWNIGQDNTFTKTFEKGDVLFGRRRAYLKKAAVAPCKGICSGDITVIRAREDKILPELLPFVIQNDIFFNYAVGKSAGSLSPRVKWEHLANYEFNLPELDEQKKLAKVLWQIVATMESYKKLLAKTDEMVKAKFVEQIENDGSKIKREKLNTLCNFISGGTPDTKHPEYYGGDIPWISTVALGANYIDKTSAKDFLTELGVNKSATHLIKKGTLLFGNRVGVGKTSITNCDMCTNQDILALTDVDETKINILYLKIVLDMQRNYFESQKRGATIKGIPIDVLGNIFIPIPPLQLQNQFADFVQKSEESKAAIQSSLNSFSEVYKKIIAEKLGGSN